MGSFGWQNPWPFEWGGGETPDESVYQAWRSALGSLPCQDDTGIDGLWRQCRSAAVANVCTFVERAVMQAFPQTATEHLPLWEAYLRLSPSSEATDEDRRQDIIAAYARRMRADGPGLTAQLEAIDDRLSRVDMPQETSVLTMFGAPLEAVAPHHASCCAVPVHLATSDPVPTGDDYRAMMRARRVLAEALPAWVGLALCTTVGFSIEISRLGLSVVVDA